MKAYKLRLELEGSDPLVWRLLIIPAGATFYRLFDTIQHAMGWLGNSLSEHFLYEFVLTDENIRITNDDDAQDENHFLALREKGYRQGKILDPFGVIDRQTSHETDHQSARETVRNPRTIKIDRYLEKYGQLTYVYDLLGDRWSHTLRLETILDDYPFGYPALLDGAGDCPPEDVGGWSGYMRFLEVYKDPTHKDHKAARDFATQQRYGPLDINWTNYLLRCIKFKKTEWDKLGLGDGHFTLTGNELDKYR